jgi:hypothetical protein
MPTEQEIFEAEKHLEKAVDGLLAYLEQRRAGDGPDIERCRHLVEQLKIATDEYLMILSALAL